MNIGQRVKVTLELEATHPIPAGFHWGTVAMFLISKLPGFKLIKTEVEIPGSSTAKPKVKPKV